MIKPELESKIIFKEIGITKKSTKDLLFVCYITEIDWLYRYSTVSF